MARNQSLFEGMQQVAQDAFYGMQQAYSDILVHGRLMVHGGGRGSMNALNMEIAENSYGLPGDGGWFSTQHTHMYGHDKYDYDTGKDGYNTEPEMWT